MRRNDKEITDQKLIESILAANSVCRLALVDGDTPYIVPMNYGYENRIFYFHSALEGTKIDLISKNSRACVEVSDMIEIVAGEVACDYGTRFRSVIGKGRIEFITGISEKKKAFALLMKQNTGRDEWGFPDKALENVSLFALTVDSLTGKVSGMS